MLPGVNVAAACFWIERSAAVGVAIPTLLVAETGSPDVAPVPVTVAVFVITVLPGIPAATITSNVTSVKPPAASVPPTGVPVPAPAPTPSWNCTVFEPLKYSP